MIYAAKYILTQNDNRDVVDNGAVAVEGNRIVDVGTLADVRARRPHDSVVDMGEAVIMPGLVNGHTHVPMSALRGYSDDKNLMDWLQKDIFPVEARLTYDIVSTSSLFSCAELIRTGCTAFFDMYMMEDAVFDAVTQAGVRAVLGESITMFFPGLAGATEEALFDRIRGYADAWKANPRVTGAVAPHAIYTTTPEMLRRCRDLADETGFLFGMHMSETTGETQGSVAQRGMRPMAYAKSLGILRGDTTLFHMVDVDDSDIATTVECGCAVVHNPASNMKLASGVAPISRMAEAGVPVAIGTDGPASNNAQNMFREMYLAALLQKVHRLDPQEASAASILDMATRGGAAALHNPEIGSLEKGKLADFIALDLSSPNMQPVHSIVSNIVYAATGMENRLTVIDGREVYRDGKFASIDYDGLVREMQSIRDWAHAHV